MMSVKKNLTIATLAALMAVPAFGATNVSRALHMSSTTAHASSLQFGDDVNPYSKASYHSTGKTGYFGSFDRNGHHFTVTTQGQGVGGRITALDGNPNATNAQVEAAFDGTGNTNGTENESNSNNPESDENTSNNNVSTNIGTMNGNTNTASTENSLNTQYTSKNRLPQTGESNGASKAMALGTVALGASASMMALSFAKKHQQEAKMVMPAEPAVNNDGGSHKENNVDKNTYHMIMSNTFKSINNDLKKF